MDFQLIILLIQENLLVIKTIFLQIIFYETLLHIFCSIYLLQPFSNSPLPLKIIFFFIPIITFLFIINFKNLIYYHCQYFLLLFIIILIKNFDHQFTAYFQIRQLQIIFIIIIIFRCQVYLHQFINFHFKFHFHSLFFNLFIIIIILNFISFLRSNSFNL